MRLGDLAPDIIGLDAAARRQEITGVTADSRAVEPGFLFAALPGAKADGAAFIPDAVKSGAAAILVGGEAGIPEGLAVPVLRDPDPRRRFARLAARLHGPQPETVVAVTGTNGKTSVAAFVRQIWLAAGREAASVGTVGVSTRAGTRPGNLTTPDPVALHRTLADLAGEGIGHVAIEASSHGLVQRRLDGLRIRVGAFTNITRDHLDYHGSFEDYLAAKLRLFDAVLEPGAAAVVNLDDRYGEAVATTARINGLTVMTVGRHGGTLRLVSAEREGFAQRLVIEADGATHSVLLPLVGAFQASNALVAAGLAVATGVPAGEAIAALGGLVGASGRLEHVGDAPEAGPVFVDYAHTPDALENVLTTLRPYASGRLIAVFGCGGDRDRGKRPLMGDVAGRLADVAIVTDDNPRSEDPAAIRAEILTGAKGAREIGDRATAIRKGIEMMRPGDVLLIAGKGHETGQIVGSKVLPFSDQETVRRVLKPKPDAEPLWTTAALAEAMGAEPAGADRPVSGIYIDSRTVSRGEAFFAIRGDRLDGHDFVAPALDRGAAVAVVASDARPRYPDVRPDRLIAVDDTLDGLRRVAAAARARSLARIVAVTGSVGKTSTKEALRVALAVSGPTHASVASFNNHWGVPLTLARLPRAARFGVFEIGMNHAGEITPLSELVRPHVAVITAIAPVHLEHLGSIEAIARAKAEVFAGMEPGGAAVLNLDAPQFDLLAAEAEARGLRVVPFGTDRAAEARAEAVSLETDGSIVTATILGERIDYLLAAPGRHIVQNSLAVLAAAKLAGADLGRAAQALGQLHAPKGRGQRHALHLGEGVATLIDESYNANPASMEAAIALLGQSPVGEGGRRIAVLGDMLELGPEAPALHAALVAPLAAADVGIVHLAGPLMAALRDALPQTRRGAYAKAAAGLEPILVETLRPGDTIMIKGSAGSRMGSLVDALLARFGAAASQPGKPEA